MYDMYKVKLEEGEKMVIAGGIARTVVCVCVCVCVCVWEREREREGEMCHVCLKEISTKVY